MMIYVTGKSNDQWQMWVSHFTGCYGMSDKNVANAEDARCVPQERTFRNSDGH